MGDSKDFFFNFAVLRNSGLFSTQAPLAALSSRGLFPVCALDLLVFLPALPLLAAAFFFFGVAFFLDGVDFFLDGVAFFWDGVAFPLAAARLTGAGSSLSLSL
jgi:hypothetical protein